MTLTWWPWYTNLSWRFWRHVWLPAYQKQEAQLPQKESEHLTWLYCTVQKAFRYVKPFRCGPRVWQTDGRTDRLKPYSADRPISIKSKAYTDFQTLTTPTQIRLMKLFEVKSWSGYILCKCLLSLDNAFLLRKLCEYGHKWYIAENYIVWATVLPQTV